MEKDQYTEYQIVCILDEFETGKSSEYMSKKYGVSDSTIFLWKKRYAGADVNIIEEVKTLREEHALLLRMYGELSLSFRKLNELVQQDLC